LLKTDAFIDLPFLWYCPVDVACPNNELQIHCFYLPATSSYFGSWKCKLSKNASKIFNKS